jgi:hypothetical protein
MDFSFGALLNNPLVMVAAIGGLANVITTIISHRRTSDRLDTIKIEMNGRLSELLKVQGDARQAMGKLEGIAESKAEADAHADTGYKGS